ncbi:helix-turn-helix transcriptional regulator [Ancylomarina sp. 16SWW S1-10-2]|uniref:helix-turn-helix transcriptional regulator n=1 Tax=Ancylomarina sp. 16SWW S1-10-2 TaxID=2499681 RepID=UPI0012AE6A53|nr:helix-turn-helix transcriptional regulator [Ancylomarina sp. 16SWW S1-10-2]MRT92267.1 helix-turn-helix transcriptional regulator [Ancylomarina sp. 16SWW S1-10-2]
MLYRLFILLLLFQPIFVFAKDSSNLSLNDTIVTPLYNFDSDNQLTSQYSEETVYKLQNEYSNQIENGDTLMAIKTLSRLGNIYSNHASYSLAYQQFWNVLLLADKIKDLRTIARSHEQIAWLYSFFERENEAISYFQSSLKIKKELLKQGKIPKHSLSANYYGLATLFREGGNAPKSKAYLDSCFMIHYSGGENISAIEYLLAEESYYQMNQNHTQQALQKMHAIEPYFLKNEPAYLVILYSFMGDAYQKQGLSKKSEQYYNLSIKISESSKGHMNYIPRVHQKLSNLYLSMGDYKNAYQKLRESKILNEQLFDSRSENNRPLFEISDEFRKEKEAQSQLIQQQRLAQLEQEDKIWFLQKMLFSGTMIFIFIIVFFYVRHLNTKHQTERSLAKTNQELENRKNKELFELKNKELAISALQLIEKDELFIQLKNNLTNTPTPPSDLEVRKIFKSISNSNAQNWKQFEARFVSVNESFFKNLNATYPNITAGEKKLCALLKLNFSSKDIAKLLGISNDSVHTLRYRLRKKMNLDRSDNLFKHLESLG